MAALGGLTLGYPRCVVAVGVIILAVGVFSASHLVIEEDPITIFHPDEPIARADRAINQHMAGSNILDVVVESPGVEGLFEPETLRKIDAMQRYAESLPHLGGSVSIVDYLKQMNRVLHDGAPEAYELPGSRELVAQYFLLYSMSSDPTDFEEEVDYDYRTANVRFYVDSGSYRDFKVIVESLNQYLAENFNDDQLTATLSGRVNLNYHWISDLGRSHFMGLVVSLFLVWGMASLMFRSLLAGVYALVPVASSVLLVYAAMVAMGMSIGVGTSMFAAIAIGLGVDFSIHTLERMQVLYRRNGENTARTFAEFYQSTGRALLFNFLAIACGFGVLISSEVSSLRNFGGILVIAVGVSFFSSMSLLPAMLDLFRPAFISEKTTSTALGSLLLSIGLVGLMIVALVLTVPAARAETGPETAIGSAMAKQPLAETTAPGGTVLEALEAEQKTTDEGEGGGSAADTPDMPLSDEATVTADDIVQRVNSADRGEHVVRQLEMELIDRRNKRRVRKTTNYRKYYGEEMRTVMFYREPANIRGTAFLIWDYPELDKEDDQWLYLPALRKVRRVSASDRGDYFLGTDFTFEDIRLDGRLESRDYHYTLLGEESRGGETVYLLEAMPVSDEVSKALGYSKVRMQVNAESWIVSQIDFWDVKGNPLKTLQVEEVELVQGIWTRKVIAMNNIKTGHKTRFTFSGVDYQAEVTDRVFTRQALARGR